MDNIPPELSEERQRDLKRILERERAAKPSPGQVRTLPAQRIPEKAHYVGRRGKAPMTGKYRRT